MVGEVYDYGDNKSYKGVLGDDDAGSVMQAYVVICHPCVSYD